jgi:hypothetical protein
MYFLKNFTLIEVSTNKKETQISCKVVFKDFKSFTAFKGDYLQR